MPSIKDYQPKAFGERVLLLAASARHYAANICDMLSPLGGMKRIRHPSEILNDRNLPAYRSMIRNMRYAWVDWKEQIVLYRGEDGTPNKTVVIRHYGPCAAGEQILRYLLDKCSEYEGRGLDPEHDPITVDVVEYKKSNTVYRTIHFTLLLDAPTQTRKLEESSYFQITTAERKEVGQLLADTLAVLVRSLGRMVHSLLRRRLGEPESIRPSMPGQDAIQLGH